MSVNSQDYAIEAADLVKIYHTRWRRRQITAVDGISLRVPSGTTFGLLGPNGAGKTTFVKLLLSAVHPTSGRTSIFGLDSAMPESRRPVGYLPENHRFPTYFTGAGMLDLYGALSGMDSRERSKRIPELLELVGLEKWGDVRLGKYSKGMLQRIGLAQALLHRPKLLVLDEPTDGVDPVGRIHIRKILQSLEDTGVTIFLNSHLLAEVELFCRDVAILDKGRVALSGSVRELTSTKGYRLTAASVPDPLRETLQTRAASVTAQNGSLDFQFATLEEANEALDLLRAQRCPIHALTATTSTLEEVFVQTIEG
jgi:ABC-2 type transport system ATP-binding protein